jgi:exopolyphosphatase/pppGpp-phosphohydrolase
MGTLRVTFAPRAIAFAVDDQQGEIPVGPATLAADIRHDPPQAEELTNAVGLVLDHMEDVEREVPAVMWADRIELTGHLLDVLADVELGGAAPLPYELARDAAEDVFRTLVTEPSADRALNPGLPAEALHDVLGVACAVVAVLRFLRAESAWVVAS